MPKDERDWRDAKIPVWAKDAMENELDALRLTAALSWPTEAKPAPAPFRWGDYDHLYGEIEPGTYWQASTDAYSGAMHVEEIVIMCDSPQSGVPRVTFKVNGVRMESKQRGALYHCEADARLARLWEECEKAARRLMRMRRL